MIDVDGLAKIIAEKLKEYVEPSEPAPVKAQAPSIDENTKKEIEDIVAALVAKLKNI